MIYLDNSATTAICEKAKQNMLIAAECYGNPSSLHSAGLEAQKLVSQARTEILAALGVKNPQSKRLVFTSCGSEANNMATIGIINAKRFRFIPQIITTNSEHPSILQPLARLEQDGRAEIIRISTKGGMIDLDELRSAVNDRTVLVSIMTVNNETGAIYDTKSAFRLAKQINPDIITHTDCVQGFLKIPFSPDAVGADMVTISGHKVHAPKGVGALCLSESLVRAKKIVPIIYGGGQEQNLRSGTENVVGISALGAACTANSDISGFTAQTAKLREAFVANLPDEIKINQPVNYTSHIISVTLPGIRSETMLHYLSANDIFVSSGSACASNGKHKSYVLEAFGLSEKDTDSTLRISMGCYNTVDEMVFAAHKISEGCRTLIRSH